MWRQEMKLRNKKLFYQIKELYAPIHSRAASIALIPLARNDTSCQIYD